MKNNVKNSPVSDARTSADSHRTSNFVFKILALLMAIGIWLYAQSVNNPDSETVLSDVPITVTHLENDGLSVMSERSLSVDLTVRGKKKILDNLSVEDFSVQADASGLTEPGYYSLTPQVTGEPDGVKVVEKSLSSVSVYLDIKEKREVPISVYLADWALSDGYELGEPVPVVSNITVSGPSTLLKTIEKAQVTLSLSGYQLTSSLSMSGRVSLLTADGTVVRDSTLTANLTDVEVSVPIYTTKEVPVRVSCKNGYFTEENTKINISPATVKLKGEPSVLNTVNELVIAEIDETKMTGDTVTYPITVPDSVVNISGTDNATVTVVHNGTVLSDYVVSNITVKNGLNHTYTVRTERLNVKIRAAKETASLITSENLSAVADLASVGDMEGRCQVPVTVSIHGVDGLAYPVGEYLITLEFTD